MSFQAAERSSSGALIRLYECACADVVVRVYAKVRFLLDEAYNRNEYETNRINASIIWPDVM